MYPAPMAPTIMPIAVKTFPVPASRSIRYPIAPHTDGPASIVAVIANPVDIPAQESRGSGVRAIEPAEYTGGFEAGANQAEDVWAARRPYSVLHLPLCEFFHKPSIPMVAPGLPGPAGDQEDLPGMAAGVTDVPPWAASSRARRAWARSRSRAGTTVAAINRNAAARMPETRSRPLI